MFENYSISTLDDLERVVASLAPRLPRGAIIGLQGELGAGKTAFVKALAKVLGSQDEVRSPTFTLEHRYTLPSGETIYHWDLYRLRGQDQLHALDEVLGDPKALILVEWPATLPTALNISISHHPNGSRTLELRA